MVVPLGLGGGWEYPVRLLMGIRDGTEIYIGLGWASGVLMGVPLGREGSWDSPGQLLRGFGTVPGFTPGWVAEVGWGHSPWAE